MEYCNSKIKKRLDFSEIEFIYFDKEESISEMDIKTVYTEDKVFQDDERDNIMLQEFIVRFMKMANDKSFQKT